MSDGIVPIAYGPATPSDIEAERLAQLAATEALTNVRAAASKWAETIGTLTGLLGIGAVIKGRDDLADLEPLAQFFIAVFFLLALISAGRAIMLAALAAQGKPSDGFLFTGRRLKEKNLSDARLAAEQLNYSRKATIYAVGSLVVAVGITWFAPEEKSDPKPPNVLMSLDGQAPVCGELELTSAGALSVASAAGPVEIDDGNVSSLNVVSACPKEADD